MNNNKRRRLRQRDSGGGRDLESKIARLENRRGSKTDNVDSASLQERATTGLYGGRHRVSLSTLGRQRTFGGGGLASGTNTTTRHKSTDIAPGAPSSIRSIAGVSRHSRFSRVTRTTSSRLGHDKGGLLPTSAHIVCAVSENLARETCVASLDAGAPVTLHVIKQGNGQTYAETIAFLELLQPDEVLLNEGRRSSQLARKILKLYQIEPAETDVRALMPTLECSSQPYQMNDYDQNGYNVSYNADDNNNRDPSGACASSTVVKFVPRTFFEQTKGAELLRHVTKQDTYDTTVVEEYILLSAAHAVLFYTQRSLGASLMKHSLQVQVNAGGKNRMAIDRASALQLELLVNAKTGKTKDSLIGSIDCTKTTVGSRLLRTNLMAPPMQVETMHARLELVDTFLEHEEFFYDVMEHLSRLPDVDKMLANLALVPKMKKDDGSSERSADQRLASKGISSLVSIKTTLSALPSLARALQSHLQDLMSENGEGGRQVGNGSDETTIATERSSLLIGLGAAGDDRTKQSMSTPYVQNSSHLLLRAIIFSLTQPALHELLQAITKIFTETTTFSRNSHTQQHQECFALKCTDDSMMSVIRKAFLGNVDDIYKKADEYAEVYGFSVSVRYTGNRGYFLAIPATDGLDIPDVFIQPTVTGKMILCSTEEITSLSIRAQDNVGDLLLMTHTNIQEVLDIGRANYDALASVCDAIALLDMCHSFADVVTLDTRPWCRPVVVSQGRNRTNPEDHDESTDAEGNTSASGELIIRNGRHEVDVLRAGSGLETKSIVPNDTYASPDKPFTLITGINGSGKSTYLKQIAIITVLAQSGCYVPAEQAVVPIRDRLCTRIGNADDQEHNISTFMLEMKETAFVCSAATDRSLILIDELGRATSNEDGVALAWAVAEYLLKKHATVFFVTHYPQLSCLADIYPSVQNIHLEAPVKVGEKGSILYSHKVKQGSCQVSTDYGVELAAACGWVDDVVQSARTLQASLEHRMPDRGLCKPEVNRDSMKKKVFLTLQSINSKLGSLFNEQHSYQHIRQNMANLAVKDESLRQAMKVALLHFIRQRPIHDDNSHERSSIDASATSTDDSSLSSSSSSGTSSESDDVSSVS